jgi:hypothetical protein
MLELSDYCFSSFTVIPDYFIKGMFYIVKIRNSLRLSIIGLIFAGLVIIFVTNYNIISENNNKEMEMENESHQGQNNDHLDSEGEEWIDISLDYKEIEKIQSETKQGHKVARLSPDGTALDFIHISLGLHVLGFEKVEKSDDGNASVILSTSKGIIETYLEQPNRKAPGGIWVVKKYRWIH